MAKLIEVIATSSTRGKGTEADPVRKVYELWRKDGALLASRDSWNGDSWVNELVEEDCR